MNSLTHADRPLRLSHLLLLAFYFLLNAGLLHWWVQVDTRPLAWDQSIHTKNALEYDRRLDAGEGWAQVLRPTYFNYPPLYHFQLIPALHRVSDPADAGAIVNMVSMALLMIGVFLMGQMLFGSWPALTAALLVSCYPIVVFISHETMIDLSLTAWVAFSFYCLLRSRHFASRFWSVCFGLSLALAMLTKWTALAYLLFPVLVSVFYAIRERHKMNVVFAALAAVMVAGPWFALNVLPMLTRVRWMSSLQPASGLELKGWGKALWYPLGLFEQLHVPYLLLAVVGMGLTLMNRSCRMVWLWLLSSFVLFSLIRNHNTRYTMPALPAIALLSVAWISSTRWKAFLGLQAAIVAVFLLYVGSYLPPYNGKIKGLDVPLWSQNPPRKEQWQHDAIIDAIVAHRRAEDAFTTVVVVSNAPYFHSTTLNVSVQQRGIHGLAFKGVPKRRPTEFADFILFKTGDIGPDFTVAHVKPVAEWRTSPPSWLKPSLREKGRWPLPNRSEAVLYQIEPAATGRHVSDGMTLAFKEMSFQNITLRDMSLRALPASAQQAATGRFKKILFTAKSVEYKKISFDDVRIELEEPQVNLPLYEETGELQLFSMQSMALTAQLPVERLRELVLAKVKWLKNPVITAEGNVLSVSGRAGGVPLRAVVELSVRDAVLETTLQRIAVASIPLPRFLFQALTDRSLPLTPNADMPFELKLNAIRYEKDRIELL